MSIFSVPQKNIIVEINYIDIGGNLVFFQDKNIIKDELRGKIKTATAEFAYESWEDLNRSMKNSVTKDLKTGDSSIDPLILRDLRLRKLLRKITDGDGNNVIVNDKEISSWAPEFCIALMNAYIKSTETLYSEVLKTDEITENEILE